MERRVRYVQDERIGIYGLLHETHARIERVCDATIQRKVGISAGVHEVLLRLARSHDRRLKVTALGAALDVTTGGATRLVNRVVALGFATKEPDPADRRVQWVVLTPLGRDVVERATRLHLADLERELFSRLTRDERTDLVRLLTRLREETP
ncbi:MAG: MarR family winged helix-turn-helix transcriptional regulator [Kineosporiaceae bacterium]